jgi:UDP-glucose 4-epimerase
MLVVGAGGLLGSHVLRAAPAAVAPPGPIAWRDDPALGLAVAARWLGERSAGSAWRVAWCAGAGVVGTADDDLRTETESLRSFLDELASCPPDRGALFLASSAGGVHGGARDDPVTERSAPAPLSAYGRSKLEQERLVAEWSRSTGVPVAIGRLSNLYGPGQDLTKPQGLISRLVRASLLAEPLQVFVSLDTVRDYLFAADAAGRVGPFLERVASEASAGGPRVVTKIFASGRATTIGELIAELQRIRKRRPPIVFGATAATQLQPSTLRFRSEVFPDLDRGAVTLAEGVAAVVRDQVTALLAGRLG